MPTSSITDLTYNFTLQGSEVKSTCSNPSKAHGGIRGKIKGETKRSRRRLQRKLAKVKLPCYENVIFLTLTWSLVPEVKKQKAALKAYLQWLRRVMGCPILWRFERGSKTGRNHFHLVLFTKKYITQQRYQECWNRVGGGFVSVEWVPSRRLAKYVAKYMSKSSGSDEIFHEGDTLGKPPETTQGRACEPSGVVQEVASVNLSTCHNSTLLEEKMDWEGRTWGVHNWDSIIEWEVIRETFEDYFEFYYCMVRIRRIMRKWVKAERQRIGFVKLRGWRTVSISVGEVHKVMKAYRGGASLPAGFPMGVFRLMFCPGNRFLKFGSQAVTWTCFVSQELEDGISEEYTESVMMRNVLYVIQKLKGEYRDESKKMETEWRLRTRKKVQSWGKRVFESDN